MLPALVVAGLPVTVSAAFVRARPTLSVLEEVEQPLMWLDSIDQAVNVAGDEYRPVFVLFSSPSCPWCHRLKEMSLTEARIRELLKEFKLVEVDITLNPLVARQFQVRGVPTIAVLSSDGRVRQTVSGYLSPVQLEAVLREGLNPEFLKARDEDYSTLLATLRAGETPAGQWPTVLSHLADTAKRDELREALLGLDPFPRTNLVELLQFPRLGVRLAAIEILEERAGHTWGYDPWQPVSAISERSDAMLRWRMWAEEAASSSNVVFSALTASRLAGYIQDLLADERERSVRAMHMLEQGGEAVAEALNVYLEEHPDLSLGPARRLREVRYALLLDGMRGMDASVTAHRLIYGTLDARLRALEALPPGDPHSLQILTDFLLEEDAIVRESAAEALIRAGAYDAIPIIQTFLEGEQDPNVIYAALRGLGEVRSRRGLKILTGYLSHANEDLAIAALQSIGKLKTSLAGKEVAASLTDERWRVRVAALEAVAKLGLTAQADAAAGCIHDDDDFVRLTAIKTLAELKPGPETLKELEQAFLKDDALKGPVIAAFGSMDNPLPASFREAVRQADRDTVMACLVALDECGSGALEIAGDFCDHPDDDLACMALAIVARHGLADEAHRVQLVAALRGDAPARQQAVLENLGMNSRLRQQAQRAFPEWRRAQARPAPEAVSAPPAAEGLDSHDALFAAFGQPTVVTPVTSPPPAGAEVLDRLVAAFGGKARTGATATAGSGTGVTLRQLLLDVEQIADTGATDALRFQALRVLASAGCVPVVPRLGEGLEKRSVASRRAIAAMLAELNHPQSTLLLQQLLRDPASSVRSEAVEACLELATRTTVDAVFEELLREGSLLVVDEVFEYKLKNLADDPGGRTLITPWRQKLLQDARPAFQIMGLILADIGWEKQDAPRVQAFTTSDDPLVRRAAWHALGWNQRASLPEHAAAIAADPSASVRAVLPACIATDSSRWTYYFDDDTTWGSYLYRSDYGRSGRRRSTLDPALKAALNTLSRDDSPRIQIDAFLRLLEQREPVDLQAYVAALRSVPDTESAAYDIQRFLISNADELGPEFAVLLPFLEENRIDQDDLTRIRRGLNIDDLDAPVSLAVQRLMRQVEEGQTPVMGSYRVADTNLVVAASLDEPPLLVFFYSPGCHDCLAAEELFKALPQLFPGLEIERHNLRKVDAGRLNEALCERFHVPEADRQVSPAVFAGSGYLIKRDITYAAVASLLADAFDVPRESWYALSDEALAEAEAVLAEKRESVNLWIVLGGGLLDGVNPCAFATIIFFLSYLHVKRRTRRQILAVGVSFIAGVFVAYFALGLGLANLIKEAPIMNALGRFLNWGLAAFALVIMVLNLRDGVLCLRGRMKEMTLQLPDPLKRRIHGVIREGSRHSRFVIAAFVIGLLVSVLELACTGQVYLPILMMISMGGQGVRPYGYLLAYNLAFIVPLGAVFILAYFGLTHEQLTRFMQRHAALVKFSTALLFLALFLFFVITNLR